jgi:hypothetical protein
MLGKPAEGSGSLSEHDRWRATATPSDVDSTPDPVAVPAQRRPIEDDQPVQMSRLAFWSVVSVAVLAVAWTAFSWRVLHYLLLDAIGQAAGTALGLLLVVSIFGAVRRSR